MEFFVDGMPAGSYASEGQQRTLALSLKLGQARRFGAEGVAPLLLIDDIFGELDPTRRNALLRALPVDAQKLVSATSMQWRNEAGGGTFWTLADRKLSKVD
jgi:DNA replication and repair protein RecF